MKEKIHNTTLRYKKTIHRIWIITILLTIIFLLISLCLQNMEAPITYMYKNKEIISSSWHDIFEKICLSMLLFVAIITIGVYAICYKLKKCSGKRILGRVLVSTIVWIFSMIVIGCSKLIVCGVKWDYAPEYFEFTHQKHKLVIQEKAFLLYGGANIFQVNDDNLAFLIGHFSTDDGGRNHGKYDIQWEENYAILYYNDKSIRVEFQ